MNSPKVNEAAIGPALTLVGVSHLTLGHGYIGNYVGLVAAAYCGTLLGSKPSTVQYVRRDCFPECSRIAMPETRLIRVLLVDDHAMVRQGLRSLLHTFANIEVVGEAGDGEDALASVEKLQPDVVVMDINMPIMDGITATRHIRQKHPAIAVVGLSFYGQGNHLAAMKQAGACEVVTKEKAVEELHAAIERALQA